MTTWETLVTVTEGIVLVASPFAGCAGLAYLAAWLQDRAEDGA